MHFIPIKKELSNFSLLLLFAHTNFLIQTL